VQEKTAKNVVKSQTTSICILQI